MFKDFKPKNAEQKGRKRTECRLMMSVTARRLESEKGSECVVVERCFRVGESACGCVPLYPLFIHSLLSQSLGNEMGDGE